MLAIMAKRTVLDTLRSNIDAIDDQIHSLLLRRTDLVTQIGDLKRSLRVDGFPLRPAREAAIIRRLVARHRGPFPVATLVHLWRTLLSGQLMVQSHFNTAVFEPSTDATYCSIARDQFSAAAKVHTFTSAGQVVHAVSSGDATIGVLPLPSDKHHDPWWAALPSDGKVPPRIIARLPFLKQKTSAAEYTEALVVAKVMPEPSGEDVSLLVIGLNENADIGRVDNMLRTAGLAGDKLSTLHDRDQIGHTLHLLAIEGFVRQGDPSITHFTRSAGDVVTRIAVVGAYAKQLNIFD